jgi:hypothetical protein
MPGSPGPSSGPACVTCQIDKLQHCAVGIMEIGARAVEYAALPVLLEGDLDAMRELSRNLGDDD